MWTRPEVVSTSRVKYDKKVEGRLFNREIFSLSILQPKQIYRAIVC